MTHLSPIENLFAVEIRKGNYDFEYVERWNEVWSKQPEYGTNAYYHGSYSIVKHPLPIPGPYEILFTTLNCSEEQAAEVVEPGQWSKYFENRNGPLFKDYTDNIWRFDTAIESIHSLLRANGLNPENKNYLLIKKIV